MRETLRLPNHGDAPRRVELSLLFDADFADLFEVKDELEQERRVAVRQWTETG